MPANRRPERRGPRAVATAAAILVLASTVSGHAQQEPGADERSPGVDVDTFVGGGGTASELVHMPVVTLYPGDVPVRPTGAEPGRR
jgi:hypothetical protein